MFFMTHRIISYISAVMFSFLAAASIGLDGKEMETESLYARLDSVLAESGKYIAVKEQKIAGLRDRAEAAAGLEDRLWLNKMLYDEYAVYEADSAMAYVNANIAIAGKLGRDDILQEWKLNKVFLLTAQGLMNEAEKELRTIGLAGLDDRLKFKYYDTEIYLYSHLAQFGGTRAEMTAHYHDMEMKLRNEARAYVDPDNPLYYSFLASLHGDSTDTVYDGVKAALKELVDGSSLTARTDAINAYSLADMYRKEGDSYNCEKYLIYSAIADVRSCNRDIASMEELSALLYSNGDMDRGYAYASYCLKAALQYPNRIRMVNISAVLDKFQQAYSDRSRIQEDRLRRSFHISSFLSAVLALAVLLIVLQFRRLSRSRRKLAESNGALNAHVGELSQTQKMLAEVNGELEAANIRLKENNDRLFEANYVKEKYIGYVFSICSSYITKLEEYRKSIMQDLVVGRIDEIRTLVSDTSMVQSELKEFYRSFDAVFLQIYPDFVSDFNSLVRPEERVVLKKGELLNTELRIYALIRLGINDSVKIAEFLHCSPQTVYNNRLRTRNKAVSKEEFEARIRISGKIRK